MELCRTKYEIFLCVNYLVQLDVPRLRQAVSLVALVAEQAAGLGLEFKKTPQYPTLFEKLKYFLITYLNVLHESPALSAP